MKPVPNDSTILTQYIPTSLAQYLQARPNDHNISVQDIATLLCTTCCVRLATLLQRVATLEQILERILGCNIVARTQPNEYNIMQHPQMLHKKFDHIQILVNNTQHVATHRNRVAKRAQHGLGRQCCDILRRNVFRRGLRGHYPITKLTN